MERFKDLLFLFKRKENTLGNKNTGKKELSEFLAGSFCLLSIDKKKI